VLDGRGDLAHRQHARQHGALDAELLGIEADRLVARRGTLHGEMQVERGMAAHRVVHDTHVGDDQCVDAEFGGLVDGRFPGLQVVGPGIGVDGDKHAAAALVCVADALDELRRFEVESCEMTCVGRVAESDVNGVRAVIDSGFQRWQVAGGADELHGASPS